VFVSKVFFCFWGVLCLCGRAADILEKQGRGERGRAMGKKKPPPPRKDRAAKSLYNKSGRLAVAE